MKGSENHQAFSPTEHTQSQSHPSSPVQQRTRSNRFDRGKIHSSKPSLGGWDRKRLPRLSFAQSKQCSRLSPLSLGLVKLWYFPSPSVAQDSTFTPPPHDESSPFDDFTTRDKTIYYTIFIGCFQCAKGTQGQHQMCHPSLLVFLRMCRGTACL